MNCGEKLVNFIDVNPVLKVENMPEETLDEIYEFHEKINKKYEGNRIDNTFLNLDIYAKCHENDYSRILSVSDAEKEDL